MTKNAFKILELPMELALEIVEKFSITELAAFIQTSKASWNIAFPILDALPIKHIIKVFILSSKTNNHDEMVLLAPIIRRASKTNPPLFYEALMAACHTSCGKVVSVLIGDKYSTVTKHEDTMFSTYKSHHVALGIAMNNRTPEPLDALLSAGASLESLFQGLSRDLKPQVPDERYYLHQAAQKGYLGTVKLLLSDKYKAKHKVRVDRLNAKGDTSLILAADSNHFDVVSVLLSHGASLNLTDRRNRTALSLAAGRAHIETVERLAKAGADPGVEDENGRTALHYVAEVTFVAPPDTKTIVRWCRYAAKKGGFVDKRNLRDVKGMTAWEVAIKKGNTCVGEFIRNG